MIRLLAAVLLFLTACGEESSPARKNPRIAATGSGVSVDLSGEATIGVTGSF